MTRDRYSPGADPEPDGSPDSSEGRRPGLWASLKRALRPDPLEDPGGDSVPFLQEEPVSFEPVPLAPSRTPDPVRASRPETPISEPLPTPEVATAPAPEVAAVEPAPPGPPLPDPGDASKPARLARGLASFSRSNSEREKKFAHILRDQPASKKAPTPRRRG